MSSCVDDLHESLYATSVNMSLNENAQFTSNFSAIESNNLWNYADFVSGCGL